MKVYNKLIRDKVPAILAAEGKNFKTRVATEEEYIERLRKKLIEEVDEFLEDPSLEEAAEVIEVFTALLEALKFSQKDMIKTIEEKSETQGDFESRIILETVEE
tara:strand:- start:77 stop:388 length:312 start_codon:yes stop_codon:yes gene_type:complete